MKYEIEFTNQFKRDLKLDKLFEVIDILANGCSKNDGKTAVMSWNMQQ